MNLMELLTAGVTVPYTVGTMIEVPRGALQAGRLATTADFFSFGVRCVGRRGALSMLGLH